MELLNGFSLPYTLGRDGLLTGVVAVGRTGPLNELQVSKQSGGAGMLNTGCNARPKLRQSVSCRSKSPPWK